MKAYLVRYIRKDAIAKKWNYNMELRELAKYQYHPKPIKIDCIDGSFIIGEAGEVDDEEESGLNEPGITVCLDYLDKGSVGIGLSEIKSISELKVKYIGPDLVAMQQNKIYDVMSIEHGYFRVMTEIDEDYLLPPKVFEIVE